MTITKQGKDIGNVPSKTLISVFCALSIVLTACVAPPIGKKDLIAFVQDGETTREQVARQLGGPPLKYATDRIAIWRIGEDKLGYYVASEGQEWRYSFVAEFDNNDIVRRHSLVLVKSVR